MPLLALVLTCPFIFIANNKKKDTEEYHLLKLVGIWVLCQLYITLNDKFRIPLGFICALLIVYNDTSNKKSKLLALLLGFTSLISSSVVYLLFRN